MNLKNHYDVIIIGSGIGGLAAAARLCNNGKKVLLIEKNSKAGGCCTSFKRAGFTFDAGAHLLGSCGKYGYLRNLFVKLGMSLHFYKVEPIDRYFFKNDIITVPDDFLDYIKILSKYNISKKKVEDFFAEVFSINKKSRLKNLSEIYKKTTYQNILDKYFFNKRKIQSILSAQYGFVGERPKNASVYSFIPTMLSYIKDGAFYPYGGSQAIIDEFMRVIKDQKGEVLFNSKPSRILSDKDRIIGVEINGKCVIECDYLISDISPHELYVNLLKFNKTENEKLIKSLKLSNSVFCLYIGCSIKDEILAKKIGWHFSSYDMNNNSYIYFFSPSIIDKSLAPKGCNTIQIFAETDCDKYLDDEIYRKKIEQKLINQLNFMIPQLRKNIVFMGSATPKTIERYTGNPRGAIFGWAQTPNQICCDAQFKKPKNLLQSGHWTYPGGGIMAVAIAGVTAAQMILDSYSKMHTMEIYN